MFLITVSQRCISGSFTFQKQLDRWLRSELCVVPWRPWACYWTDTHVWIMIAHLSMFPSLLLAPCSLSSTYQELSPEFLLLIFISLPLPYLFLPWHSLNLMELDWKSSAYVRMGRRQNWEQGRRRIFFELKICPRVLEKTNEPTSKQELREDEAQCGRI